MKVFIKTVFFLAIAILCITGCGKNEKFIPKQTYGIVMTGNTALRIDPMIFSGKIAQLPKGENVEITDRSFDKSTVGKTHTYWYKVKTRKGYTGWIFGGNLQIVNSRDRAKIKKIAEEFMREESERIKKSLMGKWWSVNEFDDFTSHCLELFDDGTYRSYYKGQTGGFLEGTFKFDPNTNELSFDKPTTFKTNLEILQRGQEFILRKEMEDHELRFKRISTDIKKDDDKKEGEGGQPADNPADGTKEKAQ